MAGLRIKDLKDGASLAFDLKDVLSAIGPRVKQSQWQCEVEECIGIEEIDSLELESRFNCDGRVPGEALIGLAAQTRQVIDGAFRAFDQDAEQPWIVVEAIDSTYWEVRTDDAASLAALRKVFRDIEDLRDHAV